MKDRRRAAILAIFLGGLGVHKFYLKDPGSGIFYIMLTIFSASLGFPIGWILAWIDAFALFTMSDERFDKKYNSGTQNRQRQTRRDSRSNRSNRRNPYQNREQDGRDDYGQTRSSTTKNPYSSSNRNERKRKVIKDNPFKTSGLKRLKDFELDLAEADLNRALELSPDDHAIHYGLGQLYSINEKKEKAFYHLAKAVELGYSNLGSFREDDELAYLRIQPEFDDFERSGFRQIPSAGNSNNQGPEIAKKAPVVPPTNDLLQDDLLLSQLNKLAELRKKGLLSDSEFEAEKVKLMRR